jgi:hypothetical protein
VLKAMMLLVLALLPSGILELCSELRARGIVELPAPAAYELRELPQAAVPGADCLRPGRQAAGTRSCPGPAGRAATAGPAPVRPAAAELGVPSSRGGWIHSRVLIDF